MPLSVTGETAKPWESIVAFYRDLSDANPVFRHVAVLAETLAASPFREAGLCATTSMHSLILGPSSQVLANPYVLIEPEFEPSRFRVTYHDGSEKPWARSAPPDEVYALVSRVLTKYAGW